MYDGSIRIQTEIDTKSFDAQIENTRRKLATLEKSADESMIPKQFRRSAEEAAQLNAEIEKTKNQLNGLIEKQNKLNQETNKVDFSKWTKSLRRTALALFGVQSVMSVISKASSTYLSQNEKARQKINALWVALGNLIGPIIEMIADGILKLVGYLNVFIKTLSNGKIDLTKNMNANAKSTNAAAKAQEKYNKQIASFDEANVLNDTSSTTTDTGTGIDTSFQMPELDDRIVKKLQDLAYWLKENWDWIWKVGAALGAVFGIAKISGWIKNIGNLLGNSASGLIGLGSVLKTLATIGVIAIGVDLVYKALTGRDLVNDLQDIKNELSNLHNKNNQLDNDSKKIHKNTMKILDDKDKETEAYEKNSQELAQYINFIKSNIDLSLSTIQRNEEWKNSLNTLEKGIANLDGSMERHNNTTNQSIEEVERSIKSYKKLYDQGLLNESQTKEYTDIMAKLGYNVKGTKLNYQEYADYLMSKVASGQRITQQETETLIEKMGGLNNALSDTTKRDYLIKIQSEVEKPSNSNVNSVLSYVQNKLKAGIDVVFGVGGAGIGGMISAGYRAKGGIYYPSKLPKLAVGGIINNPGRGVPYHGATIGEKAAEAVVPLTDSQQMSLLGETIGRYITVNLTNITELDGRQIARKVDKIQQNNNFVFNR